MEELHQEYYSTNLVKDLQLPNSPDVLPQPEHHKTILPIKERFKQFLKEYMEESFPLVMDITRYISERI